MKSYISWENGESQPVDLRVYLQFTKIFSLYLSYILQGISDDKYIERAIEGNSRACEKISVN